MIPNRVRTLFLLTLVVAVCSMLMTVRPTAAADEHKAKSKLLSPKDVSMTDLVRDSQKTEADNNKIAIVWWIPTEFWRVSMLKNAAVTPQQIDEIEKATKKYTIVIACSADTTDANSVSYMTEDEIRSSTKIKDSAGNEYSPLDPADIDSTVSDMLGAMKPVMAGMVGPMGQNMYCLVFPAKDKNKKPIVSATDEGKFVVTMDKKDYEYRLPLPSLVAKKECPTCHEKLSGSYKFCPYDGAKLPDLGN